MPVFQFRSFDADKVCSSCDAELAGTAEAQSAALRYAGEILIGNAAQNISCEDLRVELTDEKGLILTAVYVSVIEAPALKQGR